MNISLIIIITILVFVPIQQLDIRKKLLIYLVLVLLALQNIEGFGTGIDGEALRNIASLYNNADGTLNVRNLKATGNITADGNITTDGALNTNEINILRTNGRIQGPTVVGGANNAKTFTIYGDGNSYLGGVTVKGNVNINGGNLKLTREGAPAVGGAITGYYGSAPTYTLKNSGITTGGSIDAKGSIDAIGNISSRNDSGAGHCKYWHGAAYTQDNHRGWCSWHSGN